MVAVVGNGAPTIVIPRLMASNTPRRPCYAVQ